MTTSTDLQYELRSTVSGWEIVVILPKCIATDEGKLWLAPTDLSEMADTLRRSNGSWGVRPEIEVTA